MAPLGGGGDAGELSAAQPIGVLKARNSHMQSEHTEWLAALQLQLASLSS